MVEGFHLGALLGNEVGLVDDSEVGDFVGLWHGKDVGLREADGVAVGVEQVSCPKSIDSSDVKSPPDPTKISLKVKRYEPMPYAQHMPSP